MTYAVNEDIEMAGALAQDESDQQFQQDFPVTTKESGKATSRIEARNAKQIQMIKPYKSMFQTGLLRIPRFGF